MNLTVEQVREIEEINGTKESRTEYFEAVRAIVNGNYGTVRWRKNYMEVISLDKDNFIDIETKTIKGIRYIVAIRQYAPKAKSFYALILERKRGKWICTFNKEWFDENGNYKKGCQELKNKEYV